MSVKLPYLTTVAAFVMLSGAAWAQSDESQQTTVSVTETIVSSMPSDNCYQGPAKMAQADIESFMSDPSSLLDAYPEGGAAMTRAVRTLAGSDATTIASLVELGGSAASDDQIAALGAGLARAAEVCLRTHAAVSEYIQVTVGSSGHDTLTVTFLALTGNIETASLQGPAAAASSPAYTGGGIAAGAGAAGYQSVGNFKNAYENFSVARRRNNTEDDRNGNNNGLLGAAIVVSPIR